MSSTSPPPNVAPPPSERAAAAASLRSPAPRSAKRRANTRYAVLIGVALLALGGYFAYGHLTGDQVNTDDAQVEADVVPVSTRVGGLVLKVAVVDNQAVKAGEVLAEIDPRDYEIRVKQAEAELEAARAQAEASAAKGGQAAPNVAQIAVARANLARADAEKRKADIDLARAKRLRADKAITQVEVESAQNSYDKAQAATAQASAQLKVAEEQHSINEAKVKGAEAALDQSKIMLGYTHVVAPRDGTLSRLAAQEGQLVQAGQLLVQVVANETYLVANFKETQVGRMRAGQAAEIEVDAFPRRRFEGRVQSVAAATGARFSLLPPDNASGNFVKVVQRVPVKIQWVNPPRDVAFRAGLSADVTVHFK